MLGLWTRVAALGGALLSFGLFFTVSFHATPFYTGADIVFFFAWMPFILAGRRLAPLARRDGSRTAPRASSALRRPSSCRSRSPRSRESAGTSTRAGATRARDCRATRAVCPVLLGERAAAVDARRDRHGRPACLVLGSDGRRSERVGASSWVAWTPRPDRLIGGARRTAEVDRPARGGTTGRRRVRRTPPSNRTTTRPDDRRHAARPGEGRAGRQRGDLHHPRDRGPGHRRPAVRRLPSWPTTRCARTPGARWATTRPTTCSSAPATARRSRSSNGAVLGGPAPRGLTKLTVVEESDGNLYLK